MEKELYLATLSNQTQIYVIGRDEFEARENAKNWVQNRYFGGSTVYIANMKIVAGPQESVKFIMG